MRDWSSDVCSSDLYLVVVLHLEARLDDLLAPLQRAVGGHARAGRLQLRAHRQQIGVFLASALDRERRPGCRMRVRNDKKVELLQRLYRFRHACDAVAGMALHEHGAQIVPLLDVRSEEHTSELQSLMRLTYA